MDNFDRITFWVVFGVVQALFLAWMIWLLSEVPAADDYCYDETYSGTTSLDECVESARQWATFPATMAGLLWGLADAALLTLYFVFRFIAARRVGAMPDWG
jgi:hypothetical protein